MLLNPYRFGVEAGGGTGLLAGLVSYWKMDEASGNALDAHGTNHLTDNNTVTSATGKVGTARDFESTSVEYFSTPSSASLQMGNIEFTVALWVRCESLTGVQFILAKDDEAANREFAIYASTTFFYGFVSPTGTSAGVVSVQASTNPSTVGTWYFLVLWHDPVADRLYMQRNNGTAVQATVAGGAFAGTAQFTIGGNASASHSAFDGLIDEVGIWKRILTPAECTELWNSGNGKTYPFT